MESNHKTLLNRGVVLRKHYAFRKLNLLGLKTDQVVHIDRYVTRYLRDYDAVMKSQI